MANFTAKDVQELRRRTGVGMMECKKALTEANGDLDKAAEILREKGLAAAAKKASRIAAEGLVATVIGDNAAAVVEVNAETDFVAKNQDFVNFVDAVAQTVLKEDPANVEDLAELPLEGSNDLVGEALREKILVIGENMNIRRFARLEGVVTEYLHGGGRIGVLVRFEADADAAKKDEFEVMAKDVAMQIAAISPKYVTRDEVPEEDVENERKFLTEQAINEGKPAHIAEQIVKGRMGKFFEEYCLEDQSFVKDGSMTVKEYINSVAKELGTEIKVVEFIRFEVGEGLERREDDFADEVASMMK